MNIKSAAQVIRDSVTMDQILSLYGYQPKHGFICCPFHGEKEPSLKIYKNTGGWHCFGCERGGSVIDFVMEHENCNFQTAVRAIDHALHLGLMDPHEHPQVARENERIQHALDDFCEAVYSFCNSRILSIELGQKMRLAMVKLLEEKRDNDVRSVDADEWTEILKWKDDDQYDEYRKEMIEAFKEEVAAWRRKARRAT